jgi:hypothetical protein
VKLQVKWDIVLQKNTPQSIAYYKYAINGKTCIIELSNFDVDAIKIAIFLYNNTVIAGR